MLKGVITAIKLYKTIPIRDRPCDSCFRIDEREADDGEGHQSSLITQLDQFFHSLKAWAAHLPGGYINLLTFGTSNTQKFLMISELNQEFASPSSNRVSKRLFSSFRTFGQQLHLFFRHWFSSSFCNSGPCRRSPDGSTLKG